MMPKSWETEPPTPQGVSGRDFVGVPPGYTTPRKPTRSGFGIVPRSLTQAAEDRTPQAPRYDTSWIARPASWSPEQIADLQQQMVNAGVLTGSYRRGVWDPASQRAYTELLGVANASGKTVTQTLQQYMAAPKEKGEEEGRAPLMVTLTNPEDLILTARNVARRTIGRTLTDDEAQRFVAAYQAMESEAQKAAYATSDPDGKGGTVTAPLSAEVEAEKRMKLDHPEEHTEYGYIQRFNEFLELLGGPPVDLEKS